MATRTVYVIVALTAEDADTDNEVAQFVMTVLNRVGEGLPGMNPRLVSVAEEV